MKASTTIDQKAAAAAAHLQDALNSLGKCVQLIDDQETKTLLYHSGAIIRTLQYKLDPDYFL